jgi:hypothetical protein
MSSIPGKTSRSVPRGLSVAAAIALSVAARGGAAQSSATPAKESREAAVLAILRKIPADHDPATIRVTPLRESTNDYGCKVVAPEVRGMCGTGWQPGFDPALARRLARELCSAFGLEVVADFVPAPIAAKLDAFDARTGIGLKLRGSVADRDPSQIGPVRSRAVAEAPETDLTVDEHRALEAAGRRIHVADVQTYLACMSQDVFTPTLGYLVSVVNFLNQVTDGEDVALDAVAGARSMTFKVVPQRTCAGMSIENFVGGSFITVARSGTLKIELEARALTSPARPLATIGRPTQLQLVGFGADEGASRLTLRQSGPDGSERDLATSDSSVLFVPRTFDATRGFVLALALEPGRYRMSDVAWVGARAQ